MILTRSVKVIASAEFRSNQYEWCAGQVVAIRFLQGWKSLMSVWANEGYGSTGEQSLARLEQLAVTIQSKHLQPCKLCLLLRIIVGLMINSG